MAIDTRHDTRTIEDFIDLYRDKRLNLSPAFQRQSVWREPDRRLLISSILNGIPIPSVYLYEKAGRRGTSSFAVIDGKQRLESLLLFVGKGPLFRGADDPLWVRHSFDDSSPIERWTWADFTSQQKRQFLRTEIPTIEVEGELADIIRLFVRINATGKKLTAQERRHAHFHESPILNAAQRVADDLERYFLFHKIITPAQVQRMKHVEFVTELLVSIEQGMPINKKKRIDEVIEGGSLTGPDLQSAVSNLHRAVKIVDQILPKIQETRFSHLADYYTLVLLIHRLWSEGLTITAHDGVRNDVAGELLRRFGMDVDQVSEGIAEGTPARTSSEKARDYLLTVKEGTDSKPQRDKREKILRIVLEGVFESVDSKRAFTPTQRRILWNTSAEKRCSVCHLPMTWQDLTIDHTTAHVKGGRTTISNGAITHQRCNAAKGVKDQGVPPKKANR